MKKLWALPLLVTASCTPEEPGPTGVTVASYQSGSRIRVRRATSTVTTPDGARIETKGAPAFFDSRFNTYCTPMKAEDGQTRCLPSAGSVVPSLFGDRACKMGVVLVSKPTCPGAAPLPTVVSAAAMPADQCGPSSIMNAYTVGGEVEVDGLYWQSPMGCALIPKSTADIYRQSWQAYQIRQLGDKIAASDLALMTVKTGEE